MHDDLRAEAKALTTIDANLSRRRFMATSALAAGFAVAAGPLNAQSVITTGATGLVAGDVSIPTPDGSIPGYRAMPAAGGPFPVAIVAHEVFGMHEHIKDVARRFAKAGYFALVPALFTRVGDTSRLTTFEQIRPLIAKVTDRNVMADMDAGIAFAKASAKADTAKLGVTGFCGSGRYVWLYCAHNPALKAGVAWYGPLTGEPTETRPKNPIDIVADIKCPVLGLYGAADQGIPNETVERVREALKKAGKTGEIVLYEDTPHGFHADYRASYRPEQAKDAWARCLAWFKQYGAA
jgi:carboxymethylenebutenolidase